MDVLFFGGGAVSLPSNYGKVGIYFLMPWAVTYSVNGMCRCWALFMRHNHDVQLQQFGSLWGAMYSLVPTGDMSTSGNPVQVM